MEQNAMVQQEPLDSDVHLAQCHRIFILSVYSVLMYAYTIATCVLTCNHCMCAHDVVTHFIRL